MREHLVEVVQFDARDIETVSRGLKGRFDDQSREGWSVLFASPMLLPPAVIGGAPRPAWMVTYCRETTNGQVIRPGLAMGAN